MPAGSRSERFPYGPDDIVAPTKYRLIKRLGRGGFAEVWEAQNSFMDRIDAIKIILPRFARTETYSATQIAKEARIPNALRQRTAHVADVFDAGITDLGLPYIVMELLKGNSLREHVSKRAREKRPIDLKNVVGIACDVLDALSVAHKMRIVHLDVKPENIFLAKLFDQGHETTIAKLLDFGLAKLFEPHAAGIEGDDGLTGTPRYAAPEQFGREFGTLGAWTDTYAVGHVLYELVTGNPTFEQDGNPLPRYALENAQLNVEPPDVREFRPDIPTALATIIRRCLRKRPSDRPQSAAEIALVLSALDEALRGKRSLVSLAAISDFDLPLDALKFDTTQPSPAPALVLPVPETAQIVHGPTYVPLHSVTEVPAPSSAPRNASESFLTEPPAIGAATPPLGVPPINAAPIVVVGSGTEPLRSSPVQTQPVGRQTLRMQTAPPRPMSTATDMTDPDGPPIAVLAMLAREDKTDPDGSPSFLEHAPTSGPPELTRPGAAPHRARDTPVIAAAPANAPGVPPARASAKSVDKVFDSSPVEEPAPQTKRRIPRFPVRPSAGPMTRQRKGDMSSTSGSLAHGSFETDPPIVPLTRSRWWIPAGAVAIVVVGIGATLAIRSTSSATRADSGSPAEAGASSTSTPISAAPSASSTPLVLSAEPLPSTVASAPPPSVPAPSASATASAAASALRVPAGTARPSPSSPTQPPPTDLKTDFNLLEH